MVTGGAQGIGAATCRLFAEEGARVVVADVDAVTGAATASAIAADSTVRSAGGDSIFVPVDVADEASVERLAAAVDAKWGRIDVLVNNAAVFILRGIEATVEEWRKILDVNVMGPALVAKHVVPVMRRGGGGAIVNLASISSFIAQPNFVTYNTTKTAILGMTRCMALDLARDNIRVNAVCPGTVWTRIVQERTRAEGLDRQAADASPNWGAASMIPRLADPREIAQAIAFLASPAASYITAESLMVDAGFVHR